LFAYASSNQKMDSQKQQVA